MGEFTLLYEGEEKTLADWGLLDARRERNGLGEHTVRLMAHGRAIDDADLFEYGKTVVIYRDRELVGGGWSGGTRWFYGRVEPWEAEGNAMEENCVGQLANPWWYLSSLVYEQIWKVFGGWLDDGDHSQGPILVNQSNAHIVLNTTYDLVAHPDGKLNVGEQMAEVVQFAINKGAPIALGEFDLDVDVPIDELRGNATCAEVLLKQWRWTPDVIFNWDYSTLPYPTLSARRADDLDPVTVNLNGGRPLANIKLKVREDWKRPFVRIIYEQTNNGYLSLFPDIWPNPLPSEPEKQFNGLVTTVGLAGGQTTVEEATLRSLQIAPDEFNWWRDRTAWLQDKDTLNIDPLTANGLLSDFKYDGLDATYDPRFIYEVIEGSNPPAWLTTDKGIEFARIRVMAKITYTTKNGEVVRDRLLTHECTATTMPQGTQTFTHETTQAIADPIPVGLARKLYESMQAVSIEGSYTNVDAEVSAALDAWKVINFQTPLRPAWASVRALPMSIEDTLLTGTTSVQFGVPNSLSAGDLVELLKVTRGRLVLVGFASRSSGQSSGGAGAVDLGRKATRANSTSGAGFTPVLVVSETRDGASVGNIRMDAPGKTLQLTGAGGEGAFVFALSDIPGAGVLRARRFTFKDSNNNCQLMECYIAMTPPVPVP